jgi:glucuronokinase
MAHAAGSAHARAALAGNPSDGFGGATLAVAVHDFGARAEVREAPELHVEPPSALARAAAARLGGEVAVRWSCGVPREVGLAGSSAIVVAVLRAMAALRARPLAPADLAALALAVETEDLGIAAGLQDRVAQAFDTLVAMEFGGDEPVYEPLDPALLPPLYLAWHEGAGQPSTHVHSDLRQRHAAGDAAIHAGMRRLAGHARAARDALLAGDHAGFGRALDGSFDERARMIELDPRHVRMVDVARAEGATANYAGSGGAIVGTAPDLGAVRDALLAEGCACIRPAVGVLGAQRR